MKKALGFILVFAILLTAGGYYYYSTGLKAVDENMTDEKLLDIPEGAFGNKIASILKENDLIRDENVFKLYLKLNKVDNLKSGRYSLSQSMSVEDLVEELGKGGKNINVKKITIAEGYELRQIADKIENELGLDRERFLELTSDRKNFPQVEILNELKEGQSLEGFLFPSTYELQEDIREEDLILKMLREFEKEYNENIRANTSNIPIEDFSLNEIVTMASIIERESRRDDERPLIAAVFYNRIKDGMKLQSCATVQYALGERKEVLSNKDTQIDSLYNTYKNAGLPPAPISSVSIESLKAAVNPADVDYLFFRTKEDGTGGHTFSRTYEEHQKADPRDK